MAADGVREELSGGEYALEERRARDEMCIDRERDGHKNRQGRKEDKLRRKGGGEREGRESEMEGVWGGSQEGGRL